MIGAIKQVDKPLISILMAVYEPRMDWLREQLESLEAQTYTNLKLYIRDDCSPTVPFKEIKALVKDRIRSFPYEIRRNEENLGSNLTFERLTQEAEGEYFAYCDQDDIWLPEKLEVLQKELESSGALLACSDMYIINGEGRQKADSITKVRKRHRFKSGTELAEGLLISNFVTGCTMLMRAETAKAAVPFCPYMIHDHYLALYSAAIGKIVSLPAPLIRYRIHGNNQSGLLAGVRDKASYERIRIGVPLKKFQWLERQFSFREPLLEAIAQRRDWMRARLRNWRRKGGWITVWKNRRFGPMTAVFELVAPWFPERLFLWVIDRIRRKEIWI